MPTIALDGSDLRLDVAPPRVTLRTPDGPLAMLNAPELVRRPDELRWWYRTPQQVLLLTATHAPRLFKVHLRTGEAGVAATLKRRYSEVLGDQLQFLTCRQTADGSLLFLYESGLLCVDAEGNLRWHRIHDDVTAAFGPVDGEYVCIEKRGGLDDGRTKTYFRVADGEAIPTAA